MNVVTKRKLTPPTADELATWRAHAEAACYDVPWTFLEDEGGSSVWDSEGGSIIEGGDGEDNDGEVNLGTDDLRYIASANPLNVLRMLDQITSLEARLAAADELRERLGMARRCLDEGGHWKDHQGENQAMRHLDSALAMLNGDTTAQPPEGGKEG